MFQALQFSRSFAMCCSALLAGKKGHSRSALMKDQGATFAERYYMLVLRPTDGGIPETMGRIQPYFRAIGPEEASPYPARSVLLRHHAICRRILRSLLEALVQSTWGDCH